MKKIMILIILIILIPNVVFAETEEETEEEIMETTQDKFNISEFINEAEKYTGDVLGDIDLNDMLNNAIKGNIDNKTIYQKILKLLGSEVNSSLKILISVLVIIVIHGILKSITDNLEKNNILCSIYINSHISYGKFYRNN